MDKLATATRDHWMVERLDTGRGRTACGRILTGAFGATIASGIDCRYCRNALRRAGYNV